MAIDTGDTRLGHLEGQTDIVVQALQDIRQEVRAVNTRIDRMFVATWAIGGGIIAALIGLIVALIVQGGQVLVISTVLSKEVEHGRPSLLG